MAPLASNGHQVTDKNKMPPTSGGFVVENFAFLPHRAEAHTTVLSKSVGRAFALS